MLAPRHFPRLAATVGLFTRYGLTDLVRGQGLDTYVQPLNGDGEQKDTAETAAALRRRLVELGPAYVKLGQVLSTRGDLLPQAYIRELEHLHDDVDPVPFNEVREIIEEELGARLNRLFDEFDPTPLGSASLGQAHAARLHSGRDVVVKVQRPNIRELLADDMEYFRELARFLTTHTGTGRRVDLAGIIRQLERALADELDYRIEARNAAHFRTSLAEFPRLLAPRVIEQYSTERVLTTERIRGIKVDQIPPITLIEHDLRPLAEDITRAYLKQIAIEGTFHADPHPGNVFLVLPGDVNPPTPSEIVTFNLTSDAPVADTKIGRAELEARAEAPWQRRSIGARLALIDFGMTAHLSPATRDLCVRVMYGLAEDQGDEVAEALIELGEPLDDFDRVAYVREINDVVEHAYRSDMAQMEAGAVLNQVIQASFQRGLRLPAELTLLAKTLGHLGVVTRALDRTFEPAATVRDYMREIATERARRRLSPRQVYRVVSDAVDTLGTLPRRLDVITKRLANDGLEARLDLPQMDTLLQGLQKVANRVFTGLVLAGLLVASAMLLPYRRGLGTAGFVIAGALALYMVGSIIWTDRRPRS